MKYDWEIRKKQYLLAISNLINILKPYLILENENNSKKIKIIIVENEIAVTNDNPSSFLDIFDIPVLYTKNNSINSNNKGIKEWEDIQFCINHFDISDNDFIVKMTGRYINIYNPENFLNNEIFLENVTNYKPYFFNFLIENFINKIDDVDNNYDCLIRYNWYNERPSNIPIEDCITGLIGMRCKYVKKIPKPNENECVEWLWAKTSMNIPLEKIKIFNELGIYICPNSNNYFII